MSASLPLLMCSVRILWWSPSIHATEMWGSGSCIHTTLLLKSDLSKPGSCQLRTWSMPCCCTLYPTTVSGTSTSVCKCKAAQGISVNWNDIVTQQCMLLNTLKAEPNLMKQLKPVHLKGFVNLLNGGTHLPVHLHAKLYGQYELTGLTDMLTAVPHSEQHVPQRCPNL